jgi:hypothetical protein
MRSTLGGRTLTRQLSQDELHSFQNFIKKENIDSLKDDHNQYHSKDDQDY